MSNQIALPGFDPAPLPTSHLFFAVRPEQDAADQIAQIARRSRAEHGLSGLPLPAGRLHITLHTLGMYPKVTDELIAAADKAASGVGLRSFPVSFDRVLSFAGRASARVQRAFVLRSSGQVDALAALHAALAVSMHKAGFQVPRSSFTPHITLLYDTLSVAEQPIEPVRWTVREFVLVHSRLKQPYQFLGRWPLQD